MAGQVTWQWTKKDRGKVVFLPLDPPGKIESAMLGRTPCKGGNFSSVLHLVLHPADNGRQYRCAYKNLTASTFDLTNSKILTVGQVKQFSNEADGKDNVMNACPLRQQGGE